ncbi:class II glutamine amidotransferase domain protein [Bifidobacterium saguini DSM 23967]|uniref:Class II glutamine amidotransferase domain protein n=1 Tax=Bifidobacterium saguini DSM 23967 TaxID=1437607 RepID=A0A087DCI1_9BIFI|nr:class II glutamine amidotransferase [Bifidobacterium saguini]KFI93231.1 class II glutamine amidotransferase domain protein [Bifidobacterium saguini DSM 23967]
MCVLVTSKAGTMPSLSQIALMSEANPDGAGIAWHDGTRLHRYRNTDNQQTILYMLTHWQELEKHPFLLHFRYATHGKVSTENTHPFQYHLTDGSTGYIAHNGIAHDHTNGPYANDSRNAILAWQTGQTSLTDGSQGQYALIDSNGEIRWITRTGIPVHGQTGTINVSNLNWVSRPTIYQMDEWDTYRFNREDDEWEEGYQAGYQQALDEYGILEIEEPDSLDYTPHPTYH